MEVLKIISAIIIPYLIGSILTGDIVANFKKVDVRASGSGSIGATNVFRSMGAFYAALVLLGDALKGSLMVILGNLLGRTAGLDLAVVAGIMAIVGHNWSVFARFKGGKGVATSLGVAIALTPSLMLLIFPLWLGIFLLSRYVSLASMIAMAAYPVTVFWIFPGETQRIVFALVLAGMGIFRHQANIRRLLRGEENRFSFKKRKDANEG